MRRLASLLAATGLLISIAAAPAAAGGPPSLSFYIDGQRYRTIATPTDFSNTGAPDVTYDRIFALGAGLINVAEAKPGDRDFNGGRWAVMPIAWNTTPTQLTSAEEVFAWADAGLLTIGDTPVRMFLCTVNQVPPGQS
jgi:hypothetical protein